MSDIQPGHERLAALDVHAGELLIGGIGLSRLALRAGSTPFYAYDRAAIAARIASLRKSLPPNIEIHYAVKANPMAALLAFVRPLVDGFDVASADEMRLALDAGMPSSEVSFAGPAKRIPEIESAIGAGICINCESETELERIHRMGQALGIRPRVAFRVNPDFELKGAGMKMSGSPKPFGIDAVRVPAAIRQAIAWDVKFEGLHIFCGSQNLRTDSIIEANRKTLALAAELAAESGHPLETLNLGGGYGIPYFAGDTSIDLDAIGAALAKEIAATATGLSQTRFIVELGRYVVGEAGYYVCRVQDIKQSQGVQFIMVDGGLHHHLANSGNFGQVLRKNYPVVIGNRMADPACVTAQIVGPLCTPLDIVADRLAVPQIEIGDLVVVLQSGAYGRSASPERFLSHPSAVEILV